MTVIRTYADRTVVATGEVLEIYTLTPEQEDLILAYIDEHGPTPAPAFEELLGLTRSHVQRHLHDLADRGRIRSDLDRNRLVWSRVKVELDESLVRPEFEDRIRQSLAGRRDTASALARTLGLPADQVAATCTQMMLMGSLSATLIGSIRIYTVGPRLVTHTDTRRAASIPMSPEARFHEQLAKLPPARTIKVRPVAEKVKPAAKPAGPRKETAQAPRARQKKVRKARQVARVEAPKSKAPKPKAAKPKACKPQAPKLKVPKPKACKPRVVKEAAARPRPVKPQRPPAPEGYKRVTDIARELAVQPNTLLKWARANAEARALCIKHGPHLLATPALAEQYVAATLVPGATHGTVVPEGGLTIWQAVEQVGWSYTKIYKVLAAGELTATQVAGTVYFDPGPLTALRERLDAESAVPEGWMPLTALCEELALHPSSVLSWLRRRRFEARKYRDHQRQLALHITTAAAEAYRAHRVAVPGGIKITAEVTQEILAALPPLAPGRRRPAGSVAAVAARHGVSTATIHNVLHANPRTEQLAAQDLDAAPEVAAAPIVEPEAPAPVVRPYVTVELERQLRAELTPERRKIPGETARVAAQYGLSVKQVRNALSRIPVATA